MLGSGRHVRTAVVCLALGAALVAGGVSQADPLVCDAAPLTVSPGEHPLAARVCAVAHRITPALGALGLSNAAPVNFRLPDRVEALTQGCGPALLTATDTAETRATACLAQRGGGLGPDHGLPPHVYLDSLIAHHIALARLDQIAPDLSRPARAYLAYAVQLSTLGDTHRATLMARTATPQTIRIGDLHDVLLSVHPLRFAVLSWRHFSAQPDPKAAAADILSGQTIFWTPPDTF